MTKVQKIINHIADGGRLYIEEIENQEGDLIPVLTLYIEDDSFILRELICFSSRNYDLGCCSCSSHDTNLYDKITTSTAIHHIEKYLKKQGLLIPEEKECLTALEKYIDNITNQINNR